jgi:hypothetical protein
VVIIIIECFADICTWWWLCHAQSEQFFLTAGTGSDPKSWYGQATCKPWLTITAHLQRHHLKSNRFSEFVTPSWFRPARCIVLPMCDRCGAYSRWPTEVLNSYFFTGCAQMHSAVLKYRTQLHASFMYTNVGQSYGITVI